MRYGVLALGIAVWIGICQGWVARAYDRATNAALTEEARVAIDVRCQVQDSRAARDCRGVLKKLFLAGSLDPDLTLRTYCNSVKDAWWGGRHPAPPELCIQRYGGWQNG